MVSTNTTGLKAENIHYLALCKKSLLIPDIDKPVAGQRECLVF